MAEMDLQDWVGRRETLTDVATVFPARGLAATFNQPVDGLVPGATVPALWSWLWFLPLAPMAEVGPDGHPKRGGFLPPIPLERRMWAAAASEEAPPATTRSGSAGPTARGACCAASARL